MIETDPEKLALLYERFKDVCLVEKEVWREIFMPRDAGKGFVLTRVQDRYEVLIDDDAVESALEANIPLGGKSLAAAIHEYRDHISFVKKT
jgi:ferredoxin